MNDQEGEPTMLELGPLRLCIIERGGRMAVRTWDTESAARRDFAGIDHWPVDPDWQLDGPLRGHCQPAPGARCPRHVEDEPSPGDVIFEVDGKHASAPGTGRWGCR